MTVSKRNFLKFAFAGVGAAALGAYQAFAAKVEKLVLTEDEWRKKLTRIQFHILRKAGTERPFTSALNNEKREGSYHCVGCDQELFKSSTKYDSGTGWPSFYDVVEGSVGTKTDYVLIYPRTEYHCSRCGGHHGHVFKDGPKPTGLRYCNNGEVLTFKPAEKTQS